MSDNVKVLPEEREHGALYWFVVHTSERFGGFLKAHKKHITCIVALIAALTFLFRASIQPYIITLRIRVALIVGIIVVLYAAYRLLRGRSLLIKIAAVMIGFLFAGTAVKWGDDVHTYFSLWQRYRTLTIVDLEKMPLTADERVQPLYAMTSLGMSKAGDSWKPTTPHYVRIDDRHFFTFMMEPKYLFGRLFGKVEEVYKIPASAAAVEMSSEYAARVEFQVGENMLFSRNTYTVAVKAFGWEQYFTYEPASVIPLVDDSGQWVKVVSLRRWTGFILPRPEFGGVHVIRQEQPGFKESIRRFFLGAGEWIPPHKIWRYKFLHAQNIVPYDVSRNIANSMRFQEDFWAPLPGRHKGDVRIPDLAQDMNNQPFTTYFDVEVPNGSKLYQYFALEPYDPESRGLNTSLLIPADLPNLVYRYKHHEKGERLTGVSAVGQFVRDSKKMYDWNNNKEVEHRPFVRDIGRKRRLFLLTTVVAVSEQGGKQFAASSAPDIAITDTIRDVVVWVDPNDPSRWTEQIEQALRVAKPRE